MFVSRAHRWASKPLREVLPFFRPRGIFSKFFFCPAADVFFGRATSVETCECRARLTDRRDGAGRFARRPAAAQYERPFGSPAGFCCALPHWWRRHATVHAVMNFLLLHVCACVRVCYGSFPRGRSRHAFGCCTASELIALILYGWSAGCSRPAALIRVACGVTVGANKSRNRFNSSRKAKFWQPTLARLDILGFQSYRAR